MKMVKTMPRLGATMEKDEAERGGGWPSPAGIQA